MKNLLLRIQDGFDLWLIVTTFILLTLSPMYINQLDLYRVLGIALEVIGIFVVVNSLSSSMKNTGEPGYLKYLTNCFVNVFKAKKVVHSLSAVLTLKSSVGARLDVVNKFNSIEEKVDFLLKSVEEINNQVSENKSNAEKMMESFKSQLSHVNKTLSEEIDRHTQNYRQDLKREYYKVCTGFIVTLLGLFAANTPEQFLFTWNLWK